MTVAEVNLRFMWDVVAQIKAGESGGAFADGTIGRWTLDALAVIDATTEGPLLLVGSLLRCDSLETRLVQNVSLWRLPTSL